MDGAVHYMKVYSFDIPFMNCTIAEIIYFKLPKDSMREVNRKLQGQQKSLHNIKKFSYNPEEEHLSGNFFV